MIVRFHPRARQRVKVVTTWWKKNRLDAPTLFDDELADMIERLKDHPTRGVEYEVVDDVIFRRVLLRAHDGIHDLMTASRSSHDASHDDGHKRPRGATQRQTIRD